MNVVRMSGITVKPQNHWIIRLRGPSGRRGSTVHLCASDYAGMPFSVTICGKPYDPDDRIEASQGINAITGRECARCLRQLGETFAALRDLFLSAGKSEGEAVTLTDDILKLRRSSK